MELWAYFAHPRKLLPKKGVRVNAVAPFFTPTHITSSYAQQWRAAGLLQNTPGEVAWAIAQTATDVSLRGRCCLLTGKVMKETEGPLATLVPTWLGDDVVDQMTKGGKFFESLGGYPLPPART